jgi:nitroimidazol reductase NimA-like FMN-containing flavoprotein (pyridoxamine 5'-phosphate oxidase superfamily)
MTDRMEADEVVGTFTGISPTRCVELLHTQTVGRVAWKATAGPEILPVTYVWDDGSVIFRTSPYGPLSELSQPTDVAFEVDEIDQQHHQGWSVVVHGRAQGVVRSDEVVRLWAGSGVPWAPGMRNLLIRITPTTVSGREVAARPDHHRPR